VVQFGQSGAVVIPQPSSFQPLTVFTGTEFTGTATSYSQWTYYTGSGTTNISSFKLKRGYQAVLAQSADGKNWSKCYVAQDGDLEIGALPATLDKQVRFFYVTPWRWTSKKGICPVATSVPGPLTALWWYDWDINSSSSRDVEYVAIRQQPYWPSLSQNWQSLGINTVLGYNEPDNPVEDAYKNSRFGERCGVAFAGPTGHRFARWFAGDDGWRSFLVAVSFHSTSRCGGVAGGLRGPTLLSKSQSRRRRWLRLANV
jgi:hypothetical protein